MRSVSLYVHVPFCRRRCPYCTFYHVADTGRRLEAPFVKTLIGEFENAAAEIGSSFQIPTVYFGGGTPSVLGRGSLTALMKAVAPHVSADGTEITFEVNPEDVTDTLVQMLAGLGINRISVGVQSMSRQGQRALGRCSPATNQRAVTCAKKVFDNFNLDLLLGIPGQTREMLTRTLDQINEFEPPHLSVYCLEPGGVLETESQSFFDRVDQERAAEEYLYVCDWLREHGGWHHYEVSNYALPGFESSHNRVYWFGGEYLGIGPGAHSFLQGERYFNTASIDDYLKGGTTRQHEHRDAAQRRLEQLMLALRTSAGIAVDDLTVESEVIDDLTAEGLARVESDRIILSDRGLLLLNEIVQRLSGGR